MLKGKSRKIDQLNEKLDEREIFSDRFFFPESLKKLNTVQTYPILNNFRKILVFALFSMLQISIFA